LIHILPSRKRAGRKPK